MSPDVAKENDEDGAWTAGIGTNALVANKKEIMIGARERLGIRNLGHA
jgi:hypothetical protein